MLIILHIHNNKAPCIYTYINAVYINTHKPVFTLL